MQDNGSSLKNVSYLNVIRKVIVNAEKTFRKEHRSIMCYFRSPSSPGDLEVLILNGINSRTRKIL